MRIAAVPRSSSLALDQMKPNTGGSAVIRLDWWRFLVIAILIVGIPAALVLLGHLHSSAPGVALSMGVFALSLLVYFALRWRSLRIEIAQGTFRSDEFRKNPQNYIRGSGKLFWTWVASTFAAMLFVIIYAEIVGHPV